MSLLISKLPNGQAEIYNAVQGEGKNTGMPCIFVRLAGCNLRCCYCDSSYTWDFEKFSDCVLKLSAIEVANAIRALAISHKNVVFTGGEPLLQQGGLKDIIQELESDGSIWHFELETNGTICLDGALAKKLKQVNISPKLANSGNIDSLRDNPKVIKSFLKHFLDLGLNLSFKFVISKKTVKEDLKEVEEWSEKHSISKNLIYLMPEGIEEQDIIEGSKLLNEIAMKEGYKISYRLHVMVYGNRRGT